MYKNSLTLSYRSLLNISVLLIWAIFILQLPDSESYLLKYNYFFFVGLFGALIANSTGAGGGIIFIPFFAAYGLSESQSLATSILIQCFGMTIGSLSWLSKKSVISTSSVQISLMSRLLVIGGLSTITGVLLAQQVLNSYNVPVMLIFRVFSVLFGLILLYASLKSRNKIVTHCHLSGYDIFFIIVACVFGGITTAWISIGVGECIALVLILRGFPTMVAVSAAVCMSSIAVLTSIPLHYVENINIDWNIVLMTAPAVIIGGSIARLFSVKLGADRLKVFLAVWIFITGVVI